MMRTMWFEFSRVSKVIPNCRGLTQVDDIFAIHSAQYQPKW